jgi:hypothetical protein
MPTLVLGVIDFPYANEPPEPKKVPLAKAGKSAKPIAKGEGATEKRTVTTGEVAEYLENKYHIMRLFVEMQEPVIQMELVESVKSAIINLSLGGQVGDGIGEALNDAVSEIEREFRTFLDENELEDAGVPGVPTKAAMNGVNHRFKSKLNNVSMAEKQAGTRVGVPRVSFIDTGTYQKAFKVWTE